MIVETLSYWKFKDTKWRLPTSVAHCRERATLALTRRDLRSVCRVSPIAFANTPEGAVPVLLNSPAYNRTMAFEERWAHLTLPTIAALHPFSVVWQDRDQQWVLGVARDPELVGVEEGEPFFTEEGPLTRRLMVAYRRLSIAQGYRSHLVAAANRLQDDDCLEDLPVAPNTRIRFKVMRLDRLDKIAQAADDLVAELAYAAAFSLRALPDAMSAALAGYQHRPGPRQDSNGTTLDLNAKRTLRDLPAATFLVDDDDTLNFSFSARNSLFKSG